MRRSGLVFATLACVLALAPVVRAGDPPVPPLPAGTSASPPAAAAPPSVPSTSASPPPASPAASSSPPAASASTPASTTIPSAPAAGVAVVAMAGAIDAAWPLARSVYSTPALRPYAVDEVHARVLCGEPAPPNTASDVRDLADSVAAVRGEDAPSRAVLADISRRLNVRALAVVHLDAGKPVTRVFVAETQSFDAASYGTDEGAAGPAWSATVASLLRAFGGPPSATSPAAPTAAPSAPPLATHEEPAITNAPPKPKAFYESGWFWGALGAAAFAGGAIYFATRDNGASTIHLDMQVPH